MDWSGLGLLGVGDWGWFYGDGFCLRFSKAAYIASVQTNRNMTKLGLDSRLEARSSRTRESRRASLSTDSSLLHSSGLSMHQMFLCPGEQLSVPCIVLGNGPGELDASDSLGREDWRRVGGAALRQESCHREPPRP